MAEKNPTLKLAAKFNKASIGTEAASMPFVVSRVQFSSLEEAESVLVGARLQVTIHNNHDPEQKRLAGMEEDKLSSVVDVKKMLVGTDTISGTIQFAAKSIDVHRLADFAQKNVLLVVQRIGDAGADTPDEETAA